MVVARMTDYGMGDVALVSTMLKYKKSTVLKCVVWEVLKIVAPKVRFMTAKQKPVLIVRM